MNDIAQEELDSRNKDKNSDNKTRKSLIDEILHEIEAVKQMDITSKKREIAAIHSNKKSKEDYDKEIEAISTFVFNEKTQPQAKEKEEFDLDPEEFMRELDEREEVIKKIFSKNF